MNFFAVSFAVDIEQTAKLSIMNSIEHIFKLTPAYCISAQS